jgi:acetyl esterase/lipase
MPLTPSKTLGLLALLLAAAPLANAQQVIPLWEKGAPGFESRRNDPEQHADWWYKNIHNPSLTVYAPAPGKANGTAVIIAAGGGHRELVFNPEGVEPAQYLASLGITAFALKYRLSASRARPTPSTIPARTSAAPCARCAPAPRSGGSTHGASA